MPPSDPGPINRADDPHWQCSLGAQFYGSFNGMPFHCQQKALLAAGTTLPWENEKEERIQRIVFLDSPLPNIGSPFDDSPSNSTLAFALSSTAKKIGLGDDDDDEGDGCDWDKDGKPDCVVEARDDSIRGFVDASQSGQTQDREIIESKTTVSRNIVPMPLLPKNTIEAYVNFLNNGISDNCKSALQRIGLWNRILTTAKKIPFYDVNEIANEKAEVYFGQGNDTKELTVNQFFGEKFNGAKTHIRGTGTKASGKSGIYARLGEWRFYPFEGDSRLYFLLHEHSHYIQTGTGNLDDALANRLKVKRHEGETSSVALNRYFDSKCDPMELK